MTTSRRRPLSPSLRVAVTVAVASICSSSPWPVAHAEEESSTVLDRETRRRLKLAAVHIGEDCSASDTACSYFRPLEFAESNPDLVRDVAQKWSDNDQWEGNPIEEICGRVQAWLTDLYEVRCAETATDSHFCRPDGFDREVYRDIDPVWFLPRSFSFKHVRKTGGNSLLHLFWDLDEGESPLFHLKEIRAFEEEHAEEMAESHIEHIAQMQQSEGRKYPFIAIARDPVSRFVSSASELLRDNLQGVKDECGSLVDGEDASHTQLLQCILDSKETMLNNIHFTPMFADLYCSLKGHNVEMSLYGMEHFPSMLVALNGDPDFKKNDSSQDGLSVNDLDDEMKRRICDLYAWDVAMMRQAGLYVPHCN